jgi:hypothetical protein
MPGSRRPFSADRPGRPTCGRPAAARRSSSSASANRRRRGAPTGTAAAPAAAGLGSGLVGPALSSASALPSEIAVFATHFSGSRMLRGLPAPDAREAALSGASSGGSRSSRGTGSSSGSTVYVRSGSPMSTAPSLLDRSTLARRSGSFHGDSMPLGVPTRVVAESSTKSPGCAVAEAIPGRARSRRWWPPSMPCDLSR